MICIKNNKIRMTQGDYGASLLLRVADCCEECGDNLLPDDQIIVRIYHGPSVVVERAVNWSELEADGGEMELTLTEEESGRLPVGLYAWRVVWLREGEVRNTLLRSILEVVV